jgi:hypothetical protein
MVPGSLVPVMAVAAYSMFVSLTGWVNVAAWIPVGVGVVCLLAMVQNYRAYFRDMATNDYVSRRRADNETPETIIFQAARGMHPEAVRLLLLHRKKVWMIRHDESFDLHEWVDWVLEDAPIVHADFVIYFLQHSTAYQCMSKRELADGSKKLDPTGKVEDREQYDAFVQCLRKWLMVTQSWGESSPPQWIPPWDPEKVGLSLGVAHFLEEDEDAAEQMAE